MTPLTRSSLYATQIPAWVSFCRDSLRSYLVLSSNGDNLSLSPWLGIRGMALWLVGREEVSLVSSVTQGE